MWFETVDQQLRQQLRQIGQEGLQQAAAMLSRLLRQPIGIDAPATINPAELPEGLDTSVTGLGISLGISGEINGAMLLFFPQASAESLSCQLLGCPQVDSLLREPASSTLREVGNIIASAFLASLDNQLGLRALPSPPQLCQARLAELLQQRQPISPAPIVWTPFSGEHRLGASLSGAIYLFPEVASLELLKEKLLGH